MTTSATERESFAYERIVRAIEESIASGTLRPGDRLPSIRRMSAEWSVSMPTVVRAYRLLEARRLVQARARSGIYVAPQTDHRPVRTDLETPLRDASEIATSDLIMRFLEVVADPDLVPLGTALPDPALLPTETLARLLGRTARRNALRSAAMSPPSGAPELRHEVARRALQPGRGVMADDVVITCGCAEAIALCLRSLTRPGDTVAIESPTYYGTIQALEVLGLKALEIPVDPALGISLEHLESAFGRVRSASEAGARGPMQFLPATWREYGMGGDIDDPRDAILAAANYLRRSGAPRDLDGALFAYNHSTSYVRAIRRFARRMRTDERAFPAYYAWQVYVRTPTGVRRITGPGA